MAPGEVLAAGSVFSGAFRIVELLGEGEMGAAYLADEISTGVRCALKALDAGLVKHEAIRKRFVAEAKATSRVASAHVLQTRDAGIDRDSGQPWFTTDVLRGEDLAMRIGRWGRQPLGDVLALVAALGDALGKAHAHGLVHYDLTPENVHLGTGKTVMVRELTISRIVSDACAADGDIIGSAVWMPPEQLELGRQLEPSANVWSLGLIAFYAATGKPYWLSASDDPSPSKALLREILHEPIAASSERARALGCKTDLPAWFDAWFARCVVRDRSRRFAQAAEAQASFAHEFDDRPRAPAGDAAEDQRTTTRLPPPAARARGSRSLPRGVLAEATGVPADARSPAPSGAPGPAAPTPRRAGRRGRTWRVLALLAAVAALVAWLRSDRLGEQSPPTPARVAAPGTDTQASPLPLPVPSGPSESAREQGEPAETGVVAAAPDAGPTPASHGWGAPGARDAPVEAAAPYDLAAALKAINRIYYGNCAVPSPGRVAITFGPSGRVKKVAVLRGDYDEPTTACVSARFGTAKVFPFQGTSQTVTAELTATR
jgi:hypothetical protein